MMHSVAQADIIFRNADFNEDGIPDNIGEIFDFVFYAIYVGSLLITFNRFVSIPR